MNDVYDRLDQALLQYGDDEAACVLGVSELDGFFHALACAPQVIAPSEWLPAIWGGEEFTPRWASAEEAETFTADALAHYNSVMTLLREGECAPLFLEDEVNGEVCLMADEWCEGFLLGMFLWDETDDEQLEDMLEPILAFTVDLDEPDQSLADREAMTASAVQAMQQRIPQAVFELREHFGISTPPEQPAPEKSGRRR